MSLHIDVLLQKQQTGMLQKDVYLLQVIGVMKMLLKLYVWLIMFLSKSKRTTPVLKDSVLNQIMQVVMQGILVLNWN